MLVEANFRQVKILPDKASMVCGFGRLTLFLSVIVSFPKNLTIFKSTFDLSRSKILQNSLTGKKRVEIKDGSRLCLQVTLVEMIGNLQNNTTVSCSHRFNICITRTNLFSEWQGEYVSCSYLIWLGVSKSQGSQNYTTVKQSLAI
jgi:hypothetical protein